MTEHILDRLLRGTLPDPDGAGQLSVPTRAVILSRSLAGREAALIEELRLGRRLLVVSDPTTYDILGRRLAAVLAPHFHLAECVLPAHPHADEATVGQIEARLDATSAEAVIAVGAGTINDLCKYAAHRQSLPYAVFATAPSMNGYTSVSAAITVDGHKKSLPATAAAGVFLDLEILCAAPPRLIQAGFGDSACRSTAQADWLMAHLLLDQPYRQAPFLLLREDEEALFAQAGDLLKGDPAAMERLARTLILSGFGMTICGGSYPASQGEHLISHYIEMIGDPALPAAFHGEQVAVATLTMAHLQHSMLRASMPPVLGSSRVTEEDLIDHFGAELGRHCWHNFSGKLLDPPRAAALNARLDRNWPAMTQRLRRVMRVPEEIMRALRAVGAPTDPAAIGLPASFYHQAVVHAREIRDRFTFLDLAAESGQLEALLMHAPNTGSADAAPLH